MLFPGFFRTFCHPVERSGGVAGAGVVALDPFYDGQSFWSLEARLDRPDQMALLVGESGPGDPSGAGHRIGKGFSGDRSGRYGAVFCQPGRDPMMGGEAVVEDNAPGGNALDAFYGDQGLEGPVSVFYRNPLF